MADTAGVAPDQIHELPDGRSLAWCEYGRPDGGPILYFHGIPGSRIDGRLVADVTAEAGVRVISPDRPGFGLSTPQAGKRSYFGWARDVESLADALGIERFAIVGYSAGGPYALATAVALGDRVTQVAIVSGVAPAEMPGYRKGTTVTDRAMLPLAQRVPRLARVLMARALKQARNDPERFAKGVNRDFSADADQRILAGGFRAVLPGLFVEAGRGGPAGIVEDFAVWARPSGLALNQIRTSVRLWHGEEDRTISMSHSRWVASQIPGAQLTAWPGAGHLHTPERWAEVFSAAQPAA
ncbi:MAG: alpha/beta fold hydrolase [Solirubrobacteraceae bacterium]